MDNEQEERLVQALELLGSSMERLYHVMQARFDIDHPPPKERNESTVTHLKTPEDRLREAQGDSEEPIEEWVGLREERFRSKAKGSEGGEPEE